MKGIMIGAAAAMLLLASCVDEPTPREAETAATAVKNDIEQNAVKAKQLSIEQAAEEATKLIEADAKQETDAANAIGENNN